MFVSVVIATIGRDSLIQSVESVLDQVLDESEFEIIVVNDGPEPLKPQAWHALVNIRILSIRGRERSVARNTGAAVSQGRYLLFLDDDGWLLPGGLKELLALAEKTSAAWIYGASRFVGGDGQVLVDHHIGAEGNIFVQVMAAEWLPIQASLIRNDLFFKTGGFETDARIIGSEDKDLCRKIALIGDFVQTPYPVTYPAQCGLIFAREVAYTFPAEGIRCQKPCEDFRDLPSIMLDEKSQPDLIQRQVRNRDRHRDRTGRVPDPNSDPDSDPDFDCQIWIHCRFTHIL